MEIINQLGHVQFWGVSPAINFLTETKQQMRILLSGCSDIRHILKTLCDLVGAKKQQPMLEIYVYFHETSKYLIARALLFLHILHEQNLNYDERIELFLDLYGNAMIKERTAKYLDGLIPDLLNFIHDEEKKTVTVLKHFVKLDSLKFEYRDEISDIFESWRMKVPFEMEKHRDQRLRYLYKDRYDFRTNLIDWDYNMLLTYWAPIVHYYHYREWRQSGLAFENRWSTYTHPNRTLSSYIPGKKKHTQESCLVRGFWGDIVCSPYIAMGVECDYPQKDKLFQKANEKYLGHAVYVTYYNLRYWLEKLQTLQQYERKFQDYYRSEERQREKEEEKKREKEEEKRREEMKKQEPIKYENEEQEEQDEEEEKIRKQRKKYYKQNEYSSRDYLKRETEVSETKYSISYQPISYYPIKYDPKTMSQEQYEYLVRKQRQYKDSKQVAYEKVQQPVLKAFTEPKFVFLPICLPMYNLKKKKFQAFFDGGVIGFSHSAYFQQDLQQLFKPDAVIFAETARFIISHRKEQREEINKKLEDIVTSNGFVVTDRKLKHHLECHKL